MQYGNNIELEVFVSVWSIRACLWMDTLHRIRYT
jgi:hypothetical protein